MPSWQSITCVIFHNVVRISTGGYGYEGGGGPPKTTGQSRGAHINHQRWQTTESSCFQYPVPPSGPPKISRSAREIFGARSASRQARQSGVQPHSIPFHSIPFERQTSQLKGIASIGICMLSVRFRRPPDKLGPLNGRLVRSLESPSCDTALSNLRSSPIRCCWTKLNRASRIGARYLAPSQRVSRVNNKLERSSNLMMNISRDHLT